MTRPELIKAIQGLVPELTQTTISSVVNALTDTINTAMTDGETVAIAGLGTFTPKDTAARTARNPSTGAIVNIPAGKKVAFKASSRLKASVK